MPGAASGPNGATATAGPQKRTTVHVTAWLWLAALLPAPNASTATRTWATMRPSFHVLSKPRSA